MPAFLRLAIRRISCTESMITESRISVRIGMRFSSEWLTLYLPAVCRTGEEGVDLGHVLAAVDAEEFLFEELAGCGVVLVRALVVGEVVREGRAGEFLCEEVDLVEKDDLYGKIGEHWVTKGVAKDVRSGC
jgi:hypothetical protein